MKHVLRLYFMGLIFFIPFCLQAQGVIRGIVLNADEPVMNATVSLSKHQVLISDSAGRFEFYLLAPGKFVL